MKKGTLIVLGIFAVLLVAVFATRERQVSEGVRRLDVPVVEKAAVTSLTLSGAKSAVLTKEGEGWKVADPAKPAEKHLADDAEVTRALDALGDLQSAQFLTDRTEKQAEAEIDDAKGLALTVVAGAKKLEVVLGKASSNGGFYVRKPKSKELFIYKGGLDWTVRKDVKGWRKKTILAGKVEDVKRVTLKSKDGAQVKAVAGEGGKWTLEETPTPADFRFDSQAVQQVASQLVGLSAQDFLEGADAADDKTGLSAAHDTVEAELKDGKKVVVHLGPAPEPGNANATVAAKVEGDAQVYQLTQWTASALRKRLDDLRDTTLLSFDPIQAKSLRIQAGGKKVEAVKEGETWKLREPKQLPAGFEFDPGQVMAQLSMLRSMRATKVLPGKVADAQAGFNAPSVEVKVELASGPAQTLTLGKAIAPVAKPADPKAAPPPEVYAKSSVDPLTYAVGDYLKTRLATGVDLFRKPPPQPSFGGGPGGMRGLEQLPPEVRKQLEAQLRAKAAN